MQCEYLRLVHVVPTLPWALLMHGLWARPILAACPKFEYFCPDLSWKSGRNFIVRLIFALDGKRNHDDAYKEGLIKCWLQWWVWHRHAHGLFLTTADSFYWHIKIICMLIPRLNLQVLRCLSSCYFSRWSASLFPHIVCCLHPMTGTYIHLNRQQPQLFTQIGIAVGRYFRMTSLYDINTTTTLIWRDSGWGYAVYWSKY